MWMQELIHTQDDIVPLKSHKIVIFIDDEKGNEESIEMEWLKLDKPNKVITDGSSPHLSVHIEDFDQDLNELSTSNLKTLSKEQIEKLKEKIEIIRQRLNLSEQVAEVP
jgi:predicted metallo-beta-lactamase superfamily hydrolase